MSRKRKLSRRQFLRASAVVTAGVLAAACVGAEDAPVEEAAAAPAPVEEEKKEAMPESKYNEAPMLAELVAAGELPIVDDRLPLEPLVITPHEEIGQYGGAWHRVATSAGDTQLYAKMTYEWLIRYNIDGTKIVPNAATSWEVSDDASEYVFHLREGMKWSDGVLFTADDIVSVYEDEWSNEELPNTPSSYVVEGEPIVIEKIDDYTVRMKFVATNGGFIRKAASLRGHYFTWRPKHYLSQFHPKYVDEAELTKKAKEAGFEFWYQLWGDKQNTRTNPEIPVIYAWQLKIPAPNDPIVAERNAYYWKVDPEGNQLPYIDQVEWALVESGAQAQLKIVQGDVDMQLRHLDISVFPLLQENKEKGDYRVMLWDTGKNDFVMGVNQTNQDPVLREIVQDDRFRFALSLGMKREDIIEAVYLGLTEPSQVSPLSASPHYFEEQAKDKTEHDPDQANAYLDDMGLTERDGEGYRLRPDGKRLSLTYEWSNALGPHFGDIGELITAHWKEIGIELIVKVSARDLFEQREDANEIDISTFASSSDFDPMIEPRSYLPMDYQGNWGKQYAKWWASEGAEGIEPTGDVRKVLELWDQARVAVDEQEQRRLFRQILELNKKHLWMIGISTPPPTAVVVKNNFRNVPEQALMDDQVRGPGHTATEQYFIKQE